MADNNMLNLGQSSETKYSLKGYLNKQETVAPIARDIAQAIQVADNTFKGFSEIQDKATQSRYFNAVTDFNNLRTQQQDDLGAVGNDLNAQRQVLDKYKDSFNSLSTKYELDDKYSAQLGTSIESHVSGFEEKYRSLYNAQQKDIALSNIADVTSAMIGNAKVEDVAPTLQGLKEYYKSVSGADDRTASIEVAKNFYNAKLTSFALSKENASYEQATLMRKELEASLVKFDNKITSDAGFRAAINTADALVEERRRLEEEKLKDVIKAGTVPLKTVNTMISDYRRRGIITTDEQAVLYQATYKDNLMDKDAKEESRRLMKEGRSADDFKYLFELSGKSVEEAKSYLDTQVKEGKIRSDRAGYILRDYARDLNREQKAKDISAFKDIISEAINTKSSLGINVKQMETMYRAASKDGSLSAEDRKQLDEHRLKYLSENNPELFAKTSLNNYSSQEIEEAKKVAGYRIEDAYKSDNPNRIAMIAQLNTNYTAKGELQTYIGSQLEDPKNFDKVYNDYVQLSKALPNSYKEIMGNDNVLKIQAIARIKSLEANGQVTADVMRKAEESLKQDIKFEPAQEKKVNNYISSNKISDVNGYRESIKGYMRIGKTFSDAVDLTDKEFTQLIVGSNNLTGLKGVTLNNKQKDMLTTGIDLVKSETNNLIDGAIYNKATDTIWFSTKGNQYAFNTGMNYNQYSRYISDYISSKTKKVSVIKQVEEAQKGFYD